MSEEFGIDQVESVLQAVIDASDLGDDILDDGKVNLDDIFKVLDINPIIEKFKGNPDFLNQLKDLDDAERETVEANLVAYAATKTSDDEQDKATNVVVKLVKFIFAGADLVSEFAKA